jgi:hypothetical protein
MTMVDGFSNLHQACTMTDDGHQFSSAFDATSSTVGHRIA